MSATTVPITFENATVMPVQRLRLLSTFSVLALVLILSTTTAAQRLPMRLYTTEDGLWSGFINAMMRDSRGFLWFCTRDGLSRFDGYRFTNYKIAGGPLAQNFTYIFESRKGTFWIVLGDRQLYRWDPTTGSAQGLQARQAHDDDRTWLPAQLVSSNRIGRMVEDRNGNLWAGGSGLWRIEETAGAVSVQEISLNLPEGWNSSFFVNVLAEGNDGGLWLGTNRGLLRRLPDGRVAHYHLSNLNPEDIHTLAADNKGFVWAIYPGGGYILSPQPISNSGSSGGFGTFQLTTSQPVEDLLPRRAGEAIDLTSAKALGTAGKGILSIYQQASGRMWLVGKSRLVSFDGRQFHSFEDARGIFSEVIEDLDGDLWISTSVGVVRFSLRGLTSYSEADGLGSRDIASIYDDREGRLHAVSSGWKISELQGKKFKSVHANVPDTGAVWTSPLGFLDHTGQWWLLTRSGLYRFAPVSQLEGLAKARPRVYRELDGLPGEWVYCMFEDSRGDLWISIRDYVKNVSGLVRWRRSDESFQKLTQADGLPALKSASSFAEDRTGNLWFGFYEGGLARYAAGRFTLFSAVDGLPEGFITSLYVDHRGRLWLSSTGGGIARIDNVSAEHPQFVRYTTQGGLFSDNARKITEDLNGDIYVGTVRGIDRLTPETGSIRHYGLGDGLAGDFVSAAYRDRKGILWFGSLSGLSRLDPQPDPMAGAPAIRIEGLRIAGVKQPLSEFGVANVAGLELTAAQSNLQIDFSSLSMARAALLRYEYKLQGVDSDWSAPTDQRTVHYANLAAGRYRFLVRAVDPNGLTSMPPASIEFHILSPLWQRWWFLTLAGLVIGCAITLLYRYRVAHLLELERVRTHIATDLHDDIGASLSQIAVLSEVVRRQVQGSTAVSEPLSTIASTSRELVDSMSDIVWAINPNRDNLDDLIHRMRRFASDLFTANDIELRFNAGETERPIKLEADMRRQIFLVFKESSHNIIRHSKCSSVEVNFFIENHVIVFTVADDGKGFDIAQANHGHGLTSMARRAKALGGILEISSRSGAGTMISLKVPLSRHVALR